jgi:hypothetical protein
MPKGRFQLDCMDQPQLADYLDDVIAIFNLPAWIR